MKIALNISEYSKKIKRRIKKDCREILKYTQVLKLKREREREKNE
jgi:hypothetical protein